MFNTQILAGSSGQGGETQQSLKFNDDESQYLSWTPAASGNRKTWTWSGWVKRGNLSTSQIFFGVHDGGSQQCWLGWNSGNTIQFFSYQGSAIANVSTQAVFRDVSAWYHLVVAFDAVNTTMNMYVNGVDQTLTFNTAISNTDHNINSSSYVHGLGRAGVLTGNDADMYLSDVYFIDGQALDATSFGQFTNGYWKKKNYSGTYGTNGFHLTFQDDVVSEGFNTVTYRGTGATQSISGLGFQNDLLWIKSRSDPAGTHRLIDSVRGGSLALQSDNTNSEINNSAQVPSPRDADGFTVTGNTSAFNQSGDTYVAWAWDAGENNAPTGHSSVTYTGNGGTQSIKGLGFEPDLVWIKERSSTSGHVLTDAVRGVNKHLVSSSTGAEATLSNGLTSFDADGFSVGANGAYNENSQTYIAWCWDAGSGSPVSNTDGSITSTVKANPDYGFSIVSYTGTGSADTVGHGLSDTPTLIITKQRSSSNPWPVNSGTLFASGNMMFLDRTDAEAFGGSNALTSYSNTTFGVSAQGVTGAINDSGETYIAYCFHSVAGYSKISSYSGTGSSGNSVTGLGFRPSFVMVKGIDVAEHWVMFDNTRSPTNPVDRYLLANTSGVEATNQSARAIDFDADGFTINGTSTEVNQSGKSYLYIAFKGSYTDYVSDLNTDGTIESRVKANPDYGFSIVSYTGTGANATVGHGLSSAPEMIITKARTNGSSYWLTYHSGLASPSTSYMSLNTSNAVDTGGASVWNSTSPTSSVFSVGTSTWINPSGGTMIAYCFAEVAGYSSIGSYTGTGAAGNAVTTGFRPAFLLYKRTDVGGNDWVIMDTTRSPANPVENRLFPNLSDAESAGAGGGIDVTDTGFVINNTYANANASGGNYIYMAFADTREAAFWKDVSGQGNHWTPINLDYRDSLPDSPTNNFAVFNAIVTTHNLSEGNLRVDCDNGTAAIPSTILAASGKWYSEISINDLGGGSTYVRIGVVTADGIGKDLGGVAGTFSFLGDGRTYSEGTATSYGTAVSAGDIFQIALDNDNGKLWFGLNGTWMASGDPAAGNNPSLTFTAGEQMGFAVSSGGGSNSPDFTANFGQDSTFAGNRAAGGNTDANGIGDFAYAPPSGFLALCTANLPTPTIIDGSEHFNTVLYTGDGATSRTITGVGFDPDFVWHKNRTSAIGHFLIDRVRGAGNNLDTSNTYAEFGGGGNGAMNSVETDGASILAGSLSATNVNTSGYAYVMWNWKAGGTAVSNSDGSITSQVSANVDAGFSIVSWTGNTTSGATVGHGLGVAPDVIIFKRRDGTSDWHTYHSSISNGNTYLAYLNTTAVPASSGSFLNSTYPSSSVITLGDSAGTNGSSMIAYCFANSDTIKAGSYVANQSTDGTFIYLGFRPAFFLAKNISRVQEWIMMNNKTTDPYNPQDGSIQPNSSAAEGTGNEVDFLSNGVKLRNSGGGLNYASGDTFIYLAFAENPFKYANAR